MVAVPELEGIDRLVQRRDEPVVASPVRRRLVAVAVSPMELLRPESDLARLVAEAPAVDLLLARDDTPVDSGEPVAELFGEDGPDWADEDWDDEADEDLGPEDEEEPDDGLAAAVAALGLPALRVHRLGLPGRIGPDVEDVLVAALSELVGFDPEAGVYCVAPLPAAADPERSVVVAAAQRIGRVYGLPLLRYRSLELCVVGD